MPDAMTMPPGGSRYRALMDALEQHPLLWDTGRPPPRRPPVRPASLSAVPCAHRVIRWLMDHAAQTSVGTCRMFRIRPAPAWLAWTIDVMQLICRHYGLAVRVVVVQAAEPWTEVWGYQPAWEQRITAVAALPYASARGRRLRDALCGIRPGQEGGRSRHRRETGLSQA